MSETAKTAKIRKKNQSEESFDTWGPWRDKVYHQVREITNYKCKILDIKDILERYIAIG